MTSIFLMAIIVTQPALAQANFDRPGSDYQSSPVASGDPMECALACEHAQKAKEFATCDGPPDYTYKAAYDEATALAAGHRPCALCRRAARSPIT